MNKVLQYKLILRCTEDASDDLRRNRTLIILDDLREMVANGELVMAEMEKMSKCEEEEVADESSPF